MPMPLKTKAFMNEWLIREKFRPVSFVAEPFYAPPTFGFERPRPQEVAAWNDQTRAKSEALLRRARELISRGWITHMGSADTAGVPRPLMAKEATRFCIHGAVQRAASEMGLSSVRTQSLELLACEAGCPPQVFNDRQVSVGPVLELLDRAIRAVALGK